MTWRAPGGQRRYAASDLVWIGFLLRLRETRMSIGQMQAFARLRGEGNTTVPDRRRMLEAHLTDVHASIDTLQRVDGGAAGQDRALPVHRGLPSGR